MPSKTILPRVARHEETAFRECIERYGDVVWTVAKLFTQTPAETEDATEEVFVYLWQNAHLWSDDKSTEDGFVAWLACKTLLVRHQRRLNGASHPDESAAIKPGHNLPDPNLLEQIRQTLRKMELNPKSSFLAFESTYPVTEPIPPSVAERILSRTPVSYKVTTELDLYRVPSARTAKKKTVLAPDEDSPCAHPSNVVEPRELLFWYLAVTAIVAAISSYLIV